MQAILTIVLFVFVLSSSASTIIPEILRQWFVFTVAKNVPDHVAMNCGDFVF